MNKLNNIKHVICIASGKGGVGKSFVSASLAAQIRRDGYKVGIIDADITGSSVARSFNLVDKRAIGTKELMDPIISKTGIKVMSVDFMFSGDKNQPVVFRSSLINQALLQFYSKTNWEELDFLLIDMPPGTSDVPITVFKEFNVDATIFVTTPQNLVGNIVQKSLNMAKLMNQNVLALVENMSYFICDNCNKKHYLFGESKLENLLKENNIDNHIQLPINNSYAKFIDEGNVENLEIQEIKNLAKIVENL